VSILVTVVMRIDQPNSIAWYTLRLNLQVSLVIEKSKKKKL